MNLTSLSENLQYMFCPKHQQQLSMVCVQKKCQENALICGICQDNDHKGHNVTLLRKFIGELKILNSEQSMKMAIDLQQEINKINSFFKSEILALKEDFDTSIYELQAGMDKYFNDLNHLCYESFKKRKEEYVVEALSSHLRHQNINQFSSFLLKLKQYETLSLSQELEIFRNSHLKKLASITHITKKINLKGELAYANNLLKIMPNSSNILHYEWSLLKASSIEISGRKATQKLSNSSGERFALAEQRNGNIGDIKIQFKINKLKGWVGIGICLKDVIVKAGFKFFYTQNLHGSYMISANGYSWSHSKPEFNSAYKSFAFHEGDIIEINYSVQHATVTFQNKKSSNKFTLSTAAIDSKDCYVPCANLCNPGDEVEIINDIS